MSHKSGSLYLDTGFGNCAAAGGQSEAPLKKARPNKKIERNFEFNKMRHALNVREVLVFMSQLTLYGLKNCDTCKKAIKALEAAGHELSFVDIRAETDLVIKVPAWLAVVGTDLLLNKRSTTWRGLSETEQAGALSGEVEALLSTNPTLIKRPVIERGDEVMVGWTPAVRESFGA